MATTRTKVMEDLMRSTVTSEERQAEILVQLDRIHNKEPDIIHTTASSFLHIVMKNDNEPSCDFFRARWLLNKGLSIAARDDQGQTVLERRLDQELFNDNHNMKADHKQAFNRFLQKLTFLLEHGADINAENPQTKLTPLEVVQEWKERSSHCWDCSHSCGKTVLDHFKPYVQPLRECRKAEDDSVITFDDLKVLLNAGRFSNLTVVVGEKEYKVHREILSERSDKFRAMLNGAMREARQDTIPLQVEDSKEFEVLLECLYKGSLHLSNRDFDPIIFLNLAVEYGIHFDLSELLDDVERSLDVDNVLDVLKQSKKYNNEELIKVCRAFLTHHHCEIVQTKREVELDQEDKNELVECLRHVAPYRLVYKSA